MKNFSVFIVTHASVFPNFLIGDMQMLNNNIQKALLFLKRECVVLKKSHNNCSEKIFFLFLNIKDTWNVRDIS